MSYELGHLSSFELILAFREFNYSVQVVFKAGKKFSIIALRTLILTMPRA